MAFLWGTLLCSCNGMSPPSSDAAVADASTKDDWKTWPFHALADRQSIPDAAPPSTEELAARKVAQEALDWVHYSELAWLDPQARLQNGVAAALRAYQQRPTLMEWPPFAEALTALAAVSSSLDYAAPPQHMDRASTILSGHTGPVNLARFSPDGQRVLTASADGTARLWDAATGRELVRYTGHTASIEYAAFSPDCTRIVTASRDNTARVWDANTGSPISILRGLNRPVTFAVFTPDGRHIVTESEGYTVTIWDIDRAAAITVLDHTAFGLSDTSLSPDGSRIVAAAGWDTARIWDVTTGTTLTPLEPGRFRPFEFVSDVTYSADGARIVGASTQGNAAAIWNAENFRLITEVMGMTGPEADSARDRRFPEMKARFSPDGTRLVTGRIFWCCADDLVWLWDATTGRIIAEFREEGEQLQGESFTRDLYVSNVAFSPDSQLLATGFSDGSTLIASAVTGKSIARVRGHSKGVLHTEFAPVGHRFVTASADGQARIWPSTVEESVHLICQRINELALQVPARFKDLPRICPEATTTRR
jgi:WD40 repeat protein